ncbi:unnamed protein product [Paramecium sonneborni]|uniref:Transmembrane protein n=1 Tax=Paramecium sonneborni TaxID=65129 RepID=A0A8S1NIH0_9CILI|nr:unnamed protein product [Paramecium sonneborni]
MLWPIIVLISSIGFLFICISIYFYLKLNSSQNQKSSSLKKQESKDNQINQTNNLEQNKQQQITQNDQQELKYLVSDQLILNQGSQIINQNKNMSSSQRNLIQQTSEKKIHYDKQDKKLSNDINEQLNFQIEQDNQKNKTNNQQINNQNSGVQQTPIDIQEENYQKASISTNQNQQTLQIVQINEKEACQTDKNSQIQIAQQNIMANYEWIQTIYLLISCSIFIEAVLARIYLQETSKKINFPIFLIQGSISALISVIIFNIVFCIPYEKIFLSTTLQFRIMSRFCLILYGITMIFPIYSGLDEFLELEYITILISFICSLIIQLFLEKLSSNCFKFPLTKLKSAPIDTNQ